MLFLWINLYIGMFLISGCTEIHKIITYDSKSTPDEFQVTIETPLVIPKILSLSSANPGIYLLNLSETYQCLIEGNQYTAHSCSTKKFLCMTSIIENSVAYPPRSKVLDQVAIVSSVVSWYNTLGATIVDAEKESQRIRKNMALRFPINSGEVPRKK